MIDNDPRIIEILLEYINIGMGKAGGVLNSILSSHINLNVPEIKLIALDNLFEELSILPDDDISIISMGYSGSIEGRVELIFSHENASRLVNALTGDDMENMDLDTIRSGTLCEIGNIVINSLMGTISNLLDTHLSYTVPDFGEGKLNYMISSIKARYPQNSYVLLAKTNFAVEALEISGALAVYFTLRSFENLVNCLKIHLE